MNNDARNGKSAAAILLQSCNVDVLKVKLGDLLSAEDEVRQESDRRRLGWSGHRPVHGCRSRGEDSSRESELTQPQQDILRVLEER